MEIEYIPLQRLQRKIHRADLTGDQVFLSCTPRPAVPVDQMYKMQESSDNEGLDPDRRSCLFGYINGQISKQSSETYLRIDLGETTEYASIRKTIHRGYTLTKWTRADRMSFNNNWTSYIDLAQSNHPQVHVERVARW